MILFFGVDTSVRFLCPLFAALSSPSAPHLLPQLAFQATQGFYHSERAASKTSKAIVPHCASGPSRKTTVLLPPLKFLCARGGFSPCVGTWQQPSGVPNSVFSRVVVSLCGRNIEKVNKQLCEESFHILPLPQNQKVSWSIWCVFLLSRIFIQQLYQSGTDCMLSTTDKSCAALFSVIYC